jgi:hypothetical protein
LAVRRGSLTITAEREGFAKLVRSGVQLTAADTLTVNLQLMVGDVKQSVEVTSAAPLLQSQSAAVSQLVDNRQVLELPLSGRQFTSLIALAPGAYVGSAGNLGSAVYALRGNSNYSVNGSQADNNSYLIDGLVNAGLWINNMVICAHARFDSGSEGNDQQLLGRVRLGGRHGDHCADQIRQQGVAWQAATNSCRTPK